MSSNVIKGYKQNYDQSAARKLDMTVREEKLAEKIEDLRSGRPAFVSGLIPAEVLDEGEYEGFSEGNPGDEGDADYGYGENNLNSSSSIDLEAFREQIREELYAEVRVRAEADFRENLQGEADTFINNAKVEAARIITEAENQAKTEAEAIKTGIISVASAEGYEAGLKKAKEEQADALRALENEKRRVTEEYERQVAVLEPAFVEILKEYLKKITGISYDYHTEIITYLIDQAIRRAPGQTEFVVKLSPGDMERYAMEIPAINEKYADKLTLTFSSSADVEPGEVRLENEGRVLTSSIGLNLNGLLESLDMLSQ